MIHTDENIEMITQTGSPGVNVPFTNSLYVQKTCMKNYIFDFSKVTLHNIKYIHIIYKNYIYYI